ncbi:hypothetical protein E4U42_003847 [Claviceps africana]|uniref:Methyltransferase n=1 Tax=Claviceps africana TaxID=83212 RepID=A0A8K0JC77_9HYPO|nr:hypothetical protein E4U42_003847 [Claviceps africana]
MSDAAAANQAYFNTLASGYDGRFLNITRRVEDEVRRRAHLLGACPGGRFLDYACGTGLLSRALGPQIGQCVGIDVSEAMVEQYNARTKREGLAGQYAAYPGNLVSADESSQGIFSSPSFFDFDHAGVGLALHHMDDCALAAKQLARRLRPGGVLFVVDFVAQQSPSEEALLPSAAGARHQGFTEPEMRRMFEGAGVGLGFAFHVLDGDVTFENDPGDGKHAVRTVFIARGEKE